MKGLITEGLVKTIKAEKLNEKDFVNMVWSMLKSDKPVHVQMKTSLKIEMRANGVFTLGEFYKEASKI
jgi:hypothetical protein